MSKIYMTFNKDLLVIRVVFPAFQFTKLTKNTNYFNAWISFFHNNGFLTVYLITQEKLAIYRFKTAVNMI